MKLFSWGNFPKIVSRSFYVDKLSTLKKKIKENKVFIPFGNGRSYGDSALNHNIIKVKPYNYFIDFDASKGLLHVQSGVLLSEILTAFVSRGWFLKVTPGTKLITIGGAIASDVHGKNHHVEGCFSECVEKFTLMLPDGEIINCNKHDTPDLFKATCGGMGLTGVIIDATIVLKKINSKYINQTTIKTKNLKETFNYFEKYKDSTYSVAWIDCLAKNDEIGKCLLMTGDFANDGKLDYQAKNKIKIPFYLPAFLLNTWTVKIFNYLYYNRVASRVSSQKVNLDSFFYPLDAIESWNKIYGNKGFIQYQFILPKEESFVGLEEILKIISGSGKGSFLAVLKLYGKSNDNYLSFPMEGYSLALDFKMEAGLFDLLNQLDDIVLKYGGRIYLAKDARVTQDVFEQGYPNIDKFRQLRKKYKMNEKFNSYQSQRIGI